MLMNGRGDGTCVVQSSGVYRNRIADAHVVQQPLALVDANPTDHNRSPLCGSCHRPVTRYLGRVGATAQEVGRGPFTSEDAYEMQPDPDEGGAGPEIDEEGVRRGHLLGTWLP